MLTPQRYLTIFALIATSVLVFLSEQLQKTSYAEDFGATPVLIVEAGRQLLHGDWSARTFLELSRLVTYQFVHGGAEHIGFNMVFLWTFGFLTAQYLGQWQALAIYLICGICGALLHTWFDPQSMAPMIGASGSVSGFAGVYLGLAIQWRLPYAEVWPLAHPIPPMQLGLFAILGFIGDLWLMSRHDNHIAYGAHLGGLISGVLIAAVVTTLYPTIESYQRQWR